MAQEKPGFMAKVEAGSGGFIGGGLLGGLKTGAIMAGIGAVAAAAIVAVGKGAWLRPGAAIVSKIPGLSGLAPATAAAGTAATKIGLKEGAKLIATEAIGFGLAGGAVGTVLGAPAGMIAGVSDISDEVNKITMQEEIAAGIKKGLTGVNVTQPVADKKLTPQQAANGLQLVGSNVNGAATTANVATRSTGNLESGSRSV